VCILGERAKGRNYHQGTLVDCDTFTSLGETAKGRYPVRAIAMMHKICREAEAAIFHRQLFDDLRHAMKRVADTHEATALAAVAASFTANAACIICLTHTGK